MPGGSGRRHPPVGVVILGMSRSGTSVLTGLFKDAGFYGGPEDEMMAANEYNPRGYNENMRVFTENERILAEAGGSWFAPPELGALQAQQGETETVRALMEEMLEEASGAPVIVKDPRIGVLLPIWGPVIDELLHPVLAIRDPLEIAMSLSRRDGTPVHSALGAWELHTTSLLASLSGRELTVVHYAQVLEDPRAGGAAVEAAAGFLAPELRGRLQIADAPGGVEPGLRHHRADKQNQWLTGFQQELWDWLRLLPAGPQHLDAPADLVHATESAHEAVGTEKLRLEIEEKILEIEEKVLEIERLRAEQLRLEALNQRLSGSLDAIAGSISWRMTQPLRDATRLVRERRQR